MDENDTFRILKRTDYHTLWKMVRALPPDERNEKYILANKDCLFNQTILNNGWDLEEWEIESVRQVKNRTHPHCQNIK